MYIKQKSSLAQYAEENGEGSDNNIPEEEDIPILLNWFKKSDKLKTCFVWDSYTVPSVVRRYLHQGGDEDIFALVGEELQIPFQLQITSSNHYVRFTFCQDDFIVGEGLVTVH